MAARFSRGAMAGIPGVSITNYLKVTIYTDGIIIAGRDHGPGQNYKYRKVIVFPRQIQEDVKMLLIEKQKEKPGLFNVEVFDTIPIEIGDHLH